MTHLLETASTWLVAHRLSGLVFGLLLVMTFAEAGLFVGFVLPGETALLLGGMLTATGVLPFWPFLVGAVLAAALGDSTGYAIGHRYGTRVRGSRLGRRLGERRWDAAGRFLVRNGGRAVFLARGQALLRALVPFLAGQARMPYGTFLRWNLVGAVLWAGGVVVLGHVFARSITTVEQALGWFGVVMLAAVVVVVVVRHRRAGRRELAGDGEAPHGAGQPAEDAGGAA